MANIGDFKNFHRALCERFNYPHDEEFWWRDQVSLIEHIAKDRDAKAVLLGEIGVTSIIPPMTTEQARQLIMITNLAREAAEPIYSKIIEDVRNTNKALNIARDELKLLREELEAVTADRDKFKYCPGVMRCAKCEFQLLKSVINMSSGSVTPGNSDPEKCPNGCGPLWRVSWEEYANQHYEAAEKYFLEAKELRERIETAEKQEPFCWVWQNENGNPGRGMYETEQAAKDAWDIISPSGKAIPLYASPVLAQPDRELLRAIVDATWSHAKESEQVPSTKTADKLIDSVLSKFPVPQQNDLAVWYGPMPESNGKTNWTAILYRKNHDCLMGGIGDGYTIDRSEYPDRVRYEADRVRYLIGELKEAPFILDYDDKKHSGYEEQQSAEVTPEFIAMLLEGRITPDKIASIENEDE